MLRRTFLSQAVAAIQALLAAAVGIPAVRYLLDPLWHRFQTGPPCGRPAFVRVAPLSALRADRPVRVVVLADRQDSYTHYPPGPIGAVWLIREEKGKDDPERLQAPSAPLPGVHCWQVICPHLGCAIGYVGSEPAGSPGVFQCPCHASGFDRLGRRVSGPSPRDMDELTCRVSPADESGERWVEVKYEVFQTGIPKKRRTG